MDPVNELPDRIARALEALEARAGRAAAGVDQERVADRVARRLRDGEMPATPGVLPRLLAWPRALKVAAAAAVLLTAGSVAILRLGAGHERGSVAAQLDGVDSLSVSEAEAVLNVVDSIRAVNASVPETSAVSVEDLSEQELRALLQAMQSTEGEL